MNILIYSFKHTNTLTNMASHLNQIYKNVYHWFKNLKMSYNIDLIFLNKKK